MRRKRNSEKEKDKFYKKFYDPTDKFKKEPRYFCYELAVDLINKAKRSSKSWYTNEDTIKGVLLLLFCWNFAAQETKKLNFENVKEALSECKEELRKLENYTIETISDKDEKLKDKIKNVYKKFKQIMGQTGATKALSLLNPRLFVMWDTKIRRRLRKFIRGIDNGKRPENYLKFLFEIQKIIQEYKIRKKIPSTVVAKKIDEYHYVEIVMKSK